MLKFNEYYSDKLEYEEITEVKFNDDTEIDNVYLGDTSIRSISTFIHDYPEWKNSEKFNDSQIKFIIDYFFYKKRSMRGDMQPFWNKSIKEFDELIKKTKDNYLIHPAILSFNNDTEICIIKQSDEWFYVLFYDKKLRKNRYFKCDQLSGITELFDDKSWW